ncbi:hypothetical protein [Nocardioides sp. InS609-2]|uniref:hypothetical protein n=1 Tax=Nocardioides sp. InS609-2 TaxID=2760705 RepID=UPI0020BF6790|nr:hypothetical protein [Nocardioides sp. InS609-2]
MSEETVLDVEMLKPHVRAVLDELRRVGDDAGRDELASVNVDELRKTLTHRKRGVGLADRSSPHCGTYHLLAYIALTLADDTGDTDYIEDALFYLDAAEIAGCR